MADNNEISSAVSEYLTGIKQQKTTELKSSVIEALDSNPDYEAELKRISQKINVPIDSVRAFPDDTKRQAVMASTDFDKLDQQYPATANLLRDREKAKITHDDVDSLSNMEWITNEIKALGNDAGRGISRAARGVNALGKGAFELGADALDSSGLVGTILPENFLRRGANVFDKLTQDSQKNIEYFKTPTEGIVSGGFHSGIESLTTNIATMPLMLFGPAGVNAYLAANVLPVGGNAYEDARQKGLSPVQAIPFATSQAAIEYATEKIPALRFIGDLKAGAPMYKVLAHQLASEIPNEQVATILQDLNEWAILNPEKPFSDYLAERPSAAAQTLIATIVGVGGQVTLGKTAQLVSDKFTGNSDEARRAEAGFDLLTRLDEFAAANKTRARDVDTFEGFMQSVVQDSPADTLYVDAKTFLQSVQDAGVRVEDITASVPSIGAQLETALQTGGDLAIPTSEFAARMAGQEYTQSLLPHLKTDPLGMSQSQAADYMKTQGEQLKAEVDKILGTQMKDDSFKQSADKVKQQIMDELGSANRFTPDVNAAYADMFSTFYAVRAAQLGITPEEMAQRYPIKVKAEAVVGGNQYAQDGQLKTNTPAFRKWFKQSKIRNDEGKPLVVYHGTKDSFDTFKQGQANKQDNGWLGEGFYFTDNAELASTYAEYIKKGSGGANVMPVYLSITNPYKATIKDKQRLQLAQNQGDKEASAKFRDELIAKGYDGVILDYRDQIGVKDDVSEIVAFTPEQIKSVFNRGTFDENDANILNQDATDTDAFKKWSHGHEVVPIGEEHDYESGEGVVVEAVHGTTGDFDTFDQTKGNPESDMGAGFYFSNTLDDVGENYAGLGPDLTQKVQLLAERIANETDREYDDPEVVAEARAQFMANEGFTMPVYVRFDNPAVLGGDGETFLTAESTYDEEYDDWSEPEGTLVDFIEALRIVAADFQDADGAQAGGFLYEQAMDNQGMKLSDVIHILKDRDSGIQHAMDDEGRMAANEIIRLALERAGFDGVIDTTVNRKFGSERRTGNSMSGMDYGTVHFIAFEPTQIKSRIGNEGTFDENNPNILKQGEGARGSIQFGDDITQQPSIITLLKGADLSTFLHESGHFFLEVTADIASRPDAPQELRDDMDAVLRWFGVENMETWRAMDINERRSFHEQFARGFEAYLFEGKSPSSEMQGVFNRFRAWLMQVYKAIKNLNVELTDEVRGVFDRMLATTEQIQAAEARNSFAPLFDTKPDFMSDQEWLAYQRSDIDATQSAVSDLETRSLRDMQWLENARSRILKALQKDNASKRKAVRDEVAAEVNAEPIYQATEMLKRGTILGDALDSPIKLSIKALEEMYGEAKQPRVRKQKEKNAFMNFLMKHGIALESRADVGGDKKGMRVGLFRKNGMGLDMLATMAEEEGYLSQEDIESDLDNGGVNKLSEMIRAAINGEKILKPEEEVAAAQAQANEMAGEAQAESEAAAREKEIADMRVMGFTEAEIETLMNAPDWRSLGYGKYGMLSSSEEAAVHPDVVANMFGFGSGDQLVRGLILARPINEVINERTDQRMLERYGDLNNPQALDRAVNEAIHNDARARFVATEANALAKATGRPRVLASAAKQFAQQLIARLKIRDIKPAQYVAAERRAAQAAEKARAGDKLVEAATEKRNQLINNYAAKAAMEAQREVEKGLRYFRKFDKEGTRKNIDPDYRDQIDQLLERFDLRNITLKELGKRKSLLAWVEAQREQGIEPPISEDLLNEAQRISYKDMSLEQFRGLVDAVRNIEHLGRLKEHLLKIADQREFNGVVEQAVETINANATQDIKAKIESNTWLDKAGSGVKEFFAMHRKFASLIRQMDGFKDGGTLWSFFVRPMNEAANTEASMREKATVELSNLFKPLLKEGGLRKKTLIPEIGRSMSLEGRIAIALNMGNETNMRRVMEGENWDITQVNAIVGSLTSEQWAFVQGVWDYIDSYWGEISAKERRVTGVTPDKVEARPFTVTTKGGERIDLKGGYYPIKYNTQRSTRSEADSAAEVQKQMERGLYANAQTARGHTKARVESTGRPLRYDFGVIFQHVDQVIHDLSWHETLIDLNRLMRSSRIDQALRDHYGAEVIRTMRKTLEDVAIGELGAENVFEQSINHLRSGATIAGLGWNLITSALQPLGLTQSIVRIGPKWVGKGMSRWLRDAASMNNSATWIYERSDFMRLRGKTQQREINEIRNKVAKGGALSAVEESFFVFIAKMQMVADVPTWLGAYEKAMASGVDENKAVAMADQAVLDSQGGGQIKDLSQIQRGGALMKLWTNFYSFFNVTYNQLAESVNETRLAGPSRAPMLAIDFLMLTIVPATLGFILKEALKGTLGDDDEDEFVQKLIKENLSYLFGMMVGIREIGSMLSSTGSYSSMAGLRFFAEMGKFIKQAQQGEADEAFWKAANNTAGIIFHYPAGAIQRVVTGTNELLEGRTTNPLSPLVGSQQKR